MIEMECVAAREAIPALLEGHASEGEIAAFDAHARGCEPCREERRLCEMLRATMASPPHELLVRIERAAVRRPEPVRPGWGLYAAAVAAVALGIGIASEPSVEVSLPVPDVADGFESGAIWASDDGLLAGAPLLDGLTDEALEQLIEELQLGASGGAA